MNQGNFDSSSLAPTVNTPGKADMNYADANPKEKPAQLMWTALILMFFLIQATVWSVAISITARDSSHAVVAGYDEQALGWDEVKMARQQSAALGWSSQFNVDQSADIRGNRKLTLRIKTTKGNLIQGATIDVIAFHRAHASAPQKIEFFEREQGVYTATIQVNRLGRWNFSGSATVKGMTFLIDQNLTIQQVKG